MASFTIDEEFRDGIHVLHAHGRITLGEGASSLRDTVRELADTGQARIILDLTDVAYVDSAGIGELVSAYTSITSGGGQFVLAGLQKRVSDLLQITKLYTVFSVYRTADEAIAALSAPSTT